MSDVGVKVGDRIQLEEYRGTVRYIGQVKGHSREWVGVEWDDALRGKHDGVVDSVRYFETADDAQSGSFVPAEKFRLGYDLVTALQTRYGEEAYDEEDMFVSTTGNKNKRIELVGLTKIEKYQKNTKQLKTVDLSGSCISQTGSLDELGKLLSGLEELNIGFNLIRRWETVVELLSALPHLSILNLSGNPFLKELAAIKIPSADDSCLSTGLKTLVLNECETSWEKAASMAGWLPKLLELQVCTNSISTLSSSQNGSLHQLEVIDLSFNKVGEWSEVCHLSKLPCLKKVNLTGNPLSSVRLRDIEPGFFQSLESLLLGECAIDSWDSVAALHLLPKLKETRLTGNPFLQDVPGGGRFEIVARVGGLVQLNGSRVSPQERVDCERRYISFVANYLLQNDLDPSSLHQVHPRYQELIAIHGEPSINASVAKQTGALHENMIEIALLCHAPSAKMGEQTKKVSVNMTFRTLKILIEKLFVLPRSRMKLYLKVDDQSFPEDITDEKDDRRLGDLHIVVGPLLSVLDDEGIS